MEAGDYKRGLILHDEQLDCFDDLLHLDFDQFFKADVALFQNGVLGWEPKLHVSKRIVSHAAESRARFAARLQKRRDEYWSKQLSCECVFCQSPQETTRRVLENYSATPAEHRLARAILSSHRWDCHKGEPGICPICSQWSNPIHATVKCGLFHARKRGERYAKEIVNDVLSRVFVKLEL